MDSDGCATSLPAAVAAFEMTSNALQAEPVVHRLAAGHLPEPLQLTVLPCERFPGL